MKLFRFFPFLSIIFFAIWPQILWAQDFKYRQFTTSDGLPSNTVYSILQDRNGFIWFATENGLSKFDGVSFENFGSESGLSDNDILSIKEDKSGKIWLLLSNGTLNYYRFGKFYSEKNDRSLAELKTTSYFNGFAEDKEGNLWFTTHSDGLFYLRKNGEVEHLMALLDIPARFISPNPFKDSNDEVWIWTEEGAINLNRNPGLLANRYKNGFYSTDHVYRTQKGKLLVGNLNRLYHSEGPQFPFHPLDSIELGNVRLLSQFAEDQHANIWISTLNGLIYFENGILDNAHKKLFLKEKACTGVFFDKEDNLWVSTFNEGVFLNSNRDVVHLTSSEISPQKPITSLWKKGSTIWFGEDLGKIGLIENGELKYIPHSSKAVNFGRGKIRGFLQDGEFEVAISEFGLIYLKNQKFYSLYPTSAKAVLDTRDDSLLIGTSGTLFKLRKEDLHAFLFKISQLKGLGKLKLEEIQKVYSDFPSVKFPRLVLANTRIFQMERDPYGTVWIASNSGLFSLKKMKFSVGKL
jgi:ligand-binding sensor domain-containing protein